MRRVSTVIVVCEECGQAVNRKPYLKRRYCSALCSTRAAAKRSVMLRTANRTPIVERFWRHVDKSGECWLWTATLATTGYGQFWDGTRLVGAHRFSWELVNGPIPDGLYACHRCDVRACVNPDHLFLGTHADNMQDCVEKGRTAKGLRNAWTKLTDEQVRQILLLRPHTRPSVLARQFGVSPQTICDITKRRRWQHVTV